MVELGRKNIYIVPSKTALALLVMIAVLFVLGINFQNALVYGVCFWLLALLLINIFYTWRNLAGLSLQAVGVEPCFAGEKAVTEIALNSPNAQAKFALVLSWAGQDEVQVNLVNTASARVKLSHLTRQRGWFMPPRLRIASRYPTGLALAWAYLQPQVRGVVYPSPQLQQGVLQGQTSAISNADGLEIADGSSDFAGVRDYQTGDTPKRIYWKKFAQTGKLYTKAFVDYASHDVWLDWDSLPITGVEARLAHLCSQVLAFHQAQRQFGLKLPDQTIPIGKGDAHQAQCLRALALYGVDDAR